MSKPVRSSAHLQFIRTLPCSVPHCQRAYVDAAHVGPHGLSQKASDLSTVPLCRKHHREYDANPRAFERARGLTLASAAHALAMKPKIQHRGRAIRRLLALGTLPLRASQHRSLHRANNLLKPLTPNSWAWRITCGHTLTG